MKTLSIITVHLNDFEGLRQTHLSVRPFTDHPEVEWIVIDGGSEPRAAWRSEALGDVAQWADVFISESDDGIFDAMNKGVELSSGEYLLFLNAGDTLVDNFPIGEVQRLCQTISPDMIWGYTIKQFSDGKSMCIKSRRPELAWIGMPACHQSVIFSRRLFREKKYDTRLPLTADYDYILWALQNGASPHQLRQPISHYAAGGQSQLHDEQARQEREQIRLKYYRIPKLFNFFLSQTERFVRALNELSPGFYRSWRKRF